HELARRRDARYSEAFPEQGDERRQGELALGEAGMRYLELRRMADPRSPHQHVEIDPPRSPPHLALARAAEHALELEQRRDQLPRLTIGEPNAHGGVEECRLRRPDRCAAIQR